MASAVEIANLALQKLGEDETLVSLDQATRAARAINQVFALVRDIVLRDHVWNFAAKRIALPALTEKPAFGPAYVYQLPADWVRVIEIQGEPAYQVEGRQIVTDAAAPLNMRYVRQITDPNLFDALFVEALSCRLAAQVAVRLTGNSEKRKELMADYVVAKAAATRADGQDNPPEDLPAGDFLMSREANWPAMLG